MTERNCNCNRRQQNQIRFNENFYRNNSCCKHDSEHEYFESFDIGLPFATGYVRPQLSAEHIFNAEKCLAAGTCFPELYQPY